MGQSCYLIDFEGNLRTFGYNDSGQLGHGYATNQWEDIPKKKSNLKDIHGDSEDTNIPKVINTLKDIQQISYGSCGRHFIAKNSQNQIFVTGNNTNGQLGTGDTRSVAIFKEINSQYSTIWRDELYTRAKSARK